MHTQEQQHTQQQDVSKYKLVIFRDLTLWESTDSADIPANVGGWRLRPGVISTLQRIEDLPQFGVVAKLHHISEAEGFTMLLDLVNEIKRQTPILHIHINLNMDLKRQVLFVTYKADVLPSDTLFIGTTAEDEAAANDVQVAFMWACQFFRGDQGV